MPGLWCSKEVDSNGRKVICDGGSFCQRNICVCPIGKIINSLKCVSAPKG